MMSKKESKCEKECKCQEEKQDEKKMSEELKELQDKYLRTLAESDNFRKRMQKEKTESISYAIESTIAEFLSLIDNFENALNFAKQASDEVKNWSIGFQMILAQMKELVHSHGIVAYHSVGCIFDPNLHDAVEIVETNDYPDSTIIEEFSKGYKSENRVIRPARVKVTKKIIEIKKEQPNEILDVDETSSKEEQTDESCE